MSFDPDRILMVTGGQETPGWATGSFEEGLMAFNLLDFDCPVTGLQQGSCVEGLTVAFSGPSQAEIPWGAQSWETLTETIKSLDPQPGVLAMRGHHDHVLADAPACLGWLDRSQRLGLEVGVALTPASMLVPAMMSNLDEHLERMFDYLGPRASVVIIEDLVEGDDGMACHSAGQGLLPGVTMGQLIDRFVPLETPVIVHSLDLESARGWLWPNMI
ncbi:MAG: hypothetical protein CMJ39_04870 [Phycisphaerae bacterium]|nr:hypothetical protein [Phycisphaerae bacterium]